MLLAAGLAAAPLRAAEQTVTPLTPQVEQRVEAVGPAAGQQVQGVDQTAVQNVGPNIEPTPGEKAARNTGKAVVGFFAVIVAIAAMAAQIIFI